MDVQIHEREIYKEDRKNIKIAVQKEWNLPTDWRLWSFFLNQNPSKFVPQFKKKTKWSKHPTPNKHSTLRKLRKLSHEKGWLFWHGMFAWMKRGKEIRGAGKEFEVWTKNAQIDFKNLLYQLSLLVSSSLPMISKKATEILMAY